MNDSIKRASGIVFALLVLFGVGMAIMVMVNQVVSDNIIVRDDVDGALTVRRLFVGDIAHAGQYLPPADARDHGKPDKDLRRLPITYWHPRGPVGKVLTRHAWMPERANTWDADARLPASLLGQGGLPGSLPAGALVAAWSEPPLAAMPMKAGTLAAYARPLQIIDFYEPNPAIHELSFPKVGLAKFTFSADAEKRGALIRVFQGNERDLLAKQAPERFYQAFFVDTVRGDLNNLAEDLLTKEGMTALMATVADHGLLAYHVSNRHYDLVQVVADTAAGLNFVALLAEDGGERGNGHYSSEWVLVARRSEDIAPLNRAAIGMKWRVPVPRKRYVWTDAGPNERAELVRGAKKDD